MSHKGNRYKAMQNGEKFYAAEMPCKRGHLGMRVTMTGACVECRRKLEKERYWNNYEKSMQTAIKFRNKNSTKIAEKARISRANETPEQRAIRLEKARIKAALWREQNPDHPGTKEAKKKYANSIQGKTKKNAESGKRRSSLLQRTPKWLTDDDHWMMEQAYELAALRTKMFGFKWHVDHVIPLRGKNVSGLHVPTNLQVIPYIENLRKINRFTPV